MNSVCRMLLVIGLVWVGWMSSFTGSAHATSQGHDLFHQGIQQTQTGQYYAAIQTFSEIIQKDSASSAALSNRCFAQVQVMAYAAAIDDCTSALNLSPTRSEAYLNRGLAYYQQGDIKTAIFDFTQALKYDLQSAEAYLDRGIAYSNLGKIRDALKDLKQAATLFREHEQTEAYQYTRGLIEELEPSISV